MYVADDECITAWWSGAWSENIFKDVPNHENWLLFAPAQSGGMAGWGIWTPDRSRAQPIILCLRSGPHFMLVLTRRAQSKSQPILTLSC